MATVNLLLRSKKNPATINLRFSHGRTMDYFCPINILVNPANFDVKNQRIKNVLEVKNRDKINIQLGTLKIFIVTEFNTAFSIGEVIDKYWLSKKVSEFFNRPQNEKKLVNESWRVYYSDYVRNWLDFKASEYRTNKKSSLTSVSISQYENFFNIIERYESKLKVKLKLTAMDCDVINSIISYLEDVEKFSELTTSRLMKRFHFFCARAEEENITVNSNYKKTYFVKKNEEILEPYLNEIEIDDIFKLNLSNHITLDNVRDNLIIGLWTGLRISDFNGNLNIDNINDGYIEIKTEKTKTWVNIPVHPMVEAILQKRDGQLPEKISDQHFNKHIKTICKLCGIDQEMKGKLFDPDTKRNKMSIYEKHLLVSSHICRRSFATNLYGTVANSVIQTVGGWASEKMMLHYIKKSKREHAEVLRDTWKKKYQSK